MISKKYIIGVIVLIFSFLIDKNILNLIIPYRHEVLNYIFLWITNISSTLVVLFVMTTLFLWEERKQRWILPLWSSLVITTAIVFLLKISIMRARPYDVLDILPLLEETTYSFPSAHAAVAFSAIPLLDKEFPKLKLFWIIFAIIVGFSRLYTGVHYLSDVIAGALIGIIVSTLIIKFEEKQGISKWMILRLKEKLHI